jgi:hypothetical protein
MFIEIWVVESANLPKRGIEVHVDVGCKSHYTTRRVARVFLEMSRESNRWPVHSFSPMQLP